MNLKTKILIKAICVIVLVALCISIYINGKDLSCNKCIIKFTTTKNGQSNFIDIQASILNEKLKQGICYVQYDATTGYYTSEN